MTRCVVYLRVSTAEQALGPEAQRDACARWAAAQGLEVAGEHQDQGVSGAAPLEARAGLLAAVGALERGDVLLVAKRDRLGRDVVAVAMIESLVERRGATVRSAAGEGTDSSDPSALLMRRMIDAFAEYERLVIKARTKAALGVKRARGERIGGVPYGWRDEGGRLVEDPREQATIRAILALREQGLTLREITRELPRRGYAPRGKGWHLASVHAILGVQR